MRRQTRIVHGPDHRMALQRPGQRGGGLGLLAEAHGQGADAPQSVEGVERRGHRPVEHRIVHSQASSSSLPATTPMVASLWPAIALVAE